MAFPWNPPPPDPSTLSIITSQEEGKEAEVEVESIGDTVFSKAWVFSVLAKMVETVQKKVSGRERGGGGGEESVGMFLM